MNNYEVVDLDVTGLTFLLELSPDELTVVRRRMSYLSADEQYLAPLCEAVLRKISVAIERADARIQ